MPAKRPADFLRRNYHWFFAGLAVVLVLGRFTPALYLSAFTADQVQIPLLYHDVVELGHSPHDWNWGGHSDIFPDVALVFILEPFLRDWVLCMQAAGGVFLAAYIAVLIILYRGSGGRNIQPFGAMLLLLFVLLLVDFGIQHHLLFNTLLGMTFHSGTAIAALGCFALCQRAASAGYAKSFWLLPVLCFITGLSDPLFLVIFTVPALATLVIMRLLYPGRLRMFPLLTGGILASAVPAHLFAIRLSPFQIDPGPYTRFDPALARNSLAQYCHLLAPSAGGDFIIFAALDIALVLFATGLFVRALFKPAASRMPPALFMLLLFGACLACSNWGAAILTGDFKSLVESRYIRPALLAPVFLGLGYINHRIPWTAASARAAVAALSLAASSCVLFWTPHPDKYYDEAQQLIPIVRAAMEKEHIQAGLADYWYAGPLTFFSRGACTTRGVYEDGSLRYWVNTTKWYTGDGASNPPPQFRFILTANLNPDKVRRLYGEPERIIPGLPGKDIWIYSKEKSISYNPVFGTLSNGPANEYRIDGDMMPSLTGRREGNSRVARAGRDRPTFLVYGPFPYLEPAPGRYRITIVHAYPAKPDPDRLALYDVIYSEGRSTKTLDQARIPFIDNSRHEFTRDIEIPANGHGLLQVRAQYFASGDFGIDSLKIVYLGK